MKKILLVCFALLWLPGMALGYDDQRVQHKDWVSSRGFSPENGHYAMLETVGIRDPANTVLGVGFFSEKQCKPANLMLAMAAPDDGIMNPIPGMATITIDNGKKHEGECVFYKDGRALVIMFEDSLLERGVFADAMRGNIIRFKIDMKGYNESIYKEYSLSGFTAAAKYSQNICRGLAR